MAQKQTQPTPRWLFRFLGWLDSTPFHGLVVAILFVAIGAVIVHIPVWETGILPKYQLNADLLFSVTWLPANLVVWLWMDRLALNSIFSFGRGLGKSEAETTGIYNDFISFGPTAAIVIALVGFVVSFIDSATKAQAMGVREPILIFVGGLIPSLGGTIEALSVIRILRQLTIVNRLYKEVKDINLFNLWPIYALSRYGYTIALGFIVLTVILDVGVNLLTGAGIGFGISLYTLAISLAIFLAPLLGINARLRSEKERELQRLGMQLDSVYDETEAAVRTRKLAKVAPLRTAAGALKEQMEAVQKVPTWPWNPGSLRNLMLPILLPLFVAILQRYLLSFLGI